MSVTCFACFKRRSQVLLLLKTFFVSLISLWKKCTCTLWWSSAVRLWEPAYTLSSYLKLSWNTGFSEGPSLISLYLHSFCCCCLYVHFSFVWKTAKHFKSQHSTPNTNYVHPKQYSNINTFTLRGLIHTTPAMLYAWWQNYRGTKLLTTKQRGWTKKEKSRTYHIKFSFRSFHFFLWGTPGFTTSVCHLWCVVLDSLFQLSNLGRSGNTERQTQLSYLPLHKNARNWQKEEKFQNITSRLLLCEWNRGDLMDFTFKESLRVSISLADFKHLITFHRNIKNINLAALWNWH